MAERRRAEAAANDARLIGLRGTEIVWDADKVSALRDNVVLLFVNAGQKGDEFGRDTAAHVLNWLSAELVEALGSDAAALELIRGELSTEDGPMKFMVPLVIPEPATK